MLKELFLKLKTSRKLKHRPAVQPCSYDTSLNIGIVANTKSIQANVFDDFVGNLMAEGKNVTVLKVDTSAGKDGVPESISRIDVSLFGDIKSERLETFLSQRYDFLLVIDHHMDFLLQFVVAHCKAGYKIGFRDFPNRKGLDLLIKPDKDRELDDLLKYTKMINHV